MPRQPRPRIAPPAVHFNRRRKVFVAHGRTMTGVHATMEAWYGCTRRSTVATPGDWGDRYNLTRGRAVGVDLAKWFRAGCSVTGATFAKMRTAARAVVIAVQQRGWRVVGVEVPVAVPLAGTATGVDLLVATAPPADAPRTWRPGIDDPVAVCEIKLIGTRIWDAPNGWTFPPGIASEGEVPATPHLLAMTQLAITHVLYSNTFPGQKQHTPQLIHLHPITGGITCTIEPLADWARARVVPDAYRRLTVGDHTPARRAPPTARVVRSRTAPARSGVVEPPPPPPAPPMAPLLPRRRAR